MLLLKLPLDARLLLQLCRSPLLAVLAQLGLSLLHDHVDVGVAADLQAHVPVAADVEALLAEGSAHADGLHHEVLRLQAVANAHQVAGVVNHFIERVFLLVAEAQLLQRVRNRETVYEARDLHHSACPDGHGPGFGGRAARALVEVHLLSLGRFNDGKCSALHHDTVHSTANRFLVLLCGMRKGPNELCAAHASGRVGHLHQRRQAEQRVLGKDATCSRNASSNRCHGTKSTEEGHERRGKLGF